MVLFGIVQVKVGVVYAAEIREDEPEDITMFIYHRGSNASMKLAMSSNGNSQKLKLCF